MGQTGSVFDMKGPMTIEPVAASPNAVSTADSFQTLREIRHTLSPHYPALRAFPSRAQFVSSPLYSQIEHELSCVLSGIEHGEHARPVKRVLPADILRIGAWNIQRGRQFDKILHMLRDDEFLAHADIILLSEVDVGMGRSHNRNVPQELAAALGYHYAFGVSYLVLGDDVKENEEGQENTLALAGQAILSRLPLSEIVSLDLPELRDKFSSKTEKRLGKKRALAACVQWNGQPLWCSTCHLDSNASPHQRRQQLSAILQEMVKHGKPVVVGGDFNTTTYDASGKWALAKDLFHKFVFSGFDATVANYMTPENSYEKPVFDLLNELGFVHEGFNDRSKGTYFYDVESPFAEAKLIEKVGVWPTRWLQRRLRPWQGRVPARLDWFVGRQVSAVQVGVQSADASDHLPLFLDFKREPPAVSAW